MWTTPRTWITGEVLSKANLDAQVRDNLNFLKTNIALEIAAELTIASGAVTKTRSHHTIDTESDAASDDLVTVNGGAEGEVILIRPSNGARTIVLKHNTGNIWSMTGMDITLDDADDYALLIYSGSKWTAICGTGSGDFKADGSVSMTDNLDFAGHEAVNMHIEQLSSDPALSIGRIYQNTIDKKLYICRAD